MNPKIKSIVEIILIIFVFIVFTYFIQTNVEFFEELIGKSLAGILIYILIIIVAIVVAPISSIPLIPLVSNIWGWQLAGIINVVGWTLGSVVVFFLTRRYGVEIIKRLISIKQIYYFENKIPKENLFLVVFLLRMVVPVDILSYALGLFSKIKFWPFVFTTVLGIIPGAFALAYVGTINLLFQVIIFLIVGIVVLVGLIMREYILL